MFSPTARPVRNGMLQQILGLDSPIDSVDDGLGISDLTALSANERDIFYELQELEESFTSYLLLPFRPSQASFVPESSITSDTPSAIMATLASADPETGHISYRMRAFQDLLSELKTITCSHVGLVAQRNDLIYATNSEIGAMISGLKKAWEHFSQSEISGIRIIPTEQAFDTYASPLATSAIVLTAVAHAVMGLARTQCNFILASLRALLIMATRLEKQPSSTFKYHLDQIPTTLPTALRRLNLAPTFDLYVTCPQCSSLYLGSTNIQTSETCSAIDIGQNLCGAALYSTHIRGNRVWKKPTKQYSHMRFESYISEMLQRPKTEIDLDYGATKLRTTPEPTIMDVWDAPYLRSFLASYDPGFFDPPGSDLSLLMMLHFDFFNPFTNKTSGKVRSIGCFFMVCLNLPPEVRYNASNAYLVSVVPGPSEARAEDLNKYMRPIVDDMLEMFSPGIWVSKTHKFPGGRRVRAAIPIKSMDLLAAWSVGGFAQHSHTCFCHLCTAKRSAMDRTTLLGFHPRSIDAHRQITSLWNSASSLAERERIYSQYGIRYTDWLRFTWWDPFKTIVVGPMHWMKNVLDKHLCKNMDWSWTTDAGIPVHHGTTIQPVNELEYAWGTSAFLTLDEVGLKNQKLTAPLLHYLCRQRGIYEAGLSSERLVEELNEDRRRKGILSTDGEVTDYAKQRFGHMQKASVARAHYYASKPGASITNIMQNTGREDLVGLCTTLGLPSTGVKQGLAARLLEHFKNTRISNMVDVETPTHKDMVSVLGKQILAEVKQDMARTVLPSWLKHPPVNFATASHGKLQCEEYKSLAIVSFTITLVRLWGKNHAPAELRARLDNFLHLMLSVRILAYQSLTELDIIAFEHHYSRYLAELKALYPACLFVPVHHIGLHIPQFLDALGPSTRYSESTCEQFIGMFQNISTNYKFGDLELTLHREFVMASRLKGLIEDNQFASTLQEFGPVVQDFVNQHIPGQTQNTWHTEHSASPITVSDSLHNALNAWSQTRSAPPFGTSFFSCTSLRLGNLRYAPCSSSQGDGCVLFSLGDVQLPGKISSILKENGSSNAHNSTRTVLLVCTFKPLSPEDAMHDPYSRHPIIGGNGARLAQLYYNEEGETYIIETRDIVAHIGICQYVDTDRSITKDCVTILSLDLKHARFE